MQSLLIFGKDGQVSTALQERCPEATFLGMDEANFTDPAGCAAKVALHKPKLVINAAAYTAVDKAEEEEPTAALINAETPGAIARACADLDIPFLHISTDYVYDGSGTRPWKPTDPTGPLSAYGRTKLAGDEAVAAAGCPFAIVRTAWVFSETGGNFVKTMLRLGAERDRLTIVSDQIGGPTPADAIAEALLTMADAFLKGAGRSGVYHFTGAPHVSWADFAREIFAQAGVSCAVEDIPSSAYPTPAARPFNSRMDCSDIKQNFGISEPDWKVTLSTVLSKLEAE